MDPSIYLMDEENKSSANVTEKTKEASLVSVINNDPAKQVENNTASDSCTDNSNSIVGNVSLEDGKSGDKLNKVPDPQESVTTAGCVSDNKGNYCLCFDDESAALFILFRVQASKMLILNEYLKCNFETAILFIQVKLLQILVEREILLLGKINWVLNQ